MYQVANFGYNIAETGHLDIYEGNNRLTFPSGFLPVVLGTTYTITLNGVYSVAGLILTGMLNDGLNSISVTTTRPFPSSGPDFGYYNLAQGTSTQSAGLSVAYDNFSISVPEPSTELCVIIGLLLVALCVRRRHSHVTDVNEPAKRPDR